MKYTIDYCGVCKDYTIFVLMSDHRHCAVCYTHKYTKKQFDELVKRELEVIDEWEDIE